MFATSALQSRPRRGAVLVGTVLVGAVLIVALGCQSNARIIELPDVAIDIAPDAGPAVIATDSVSCVGAECLPLLCAPCETDADCAPAGSRCLDRGDAGRFCGAACAISEDCPVGYRCGVDTQQCEPISGECGCSGEAVASARQTPCAVRNDAGVCTGVRSCASDGLTACSAPTPSVERCNGSDDDCDGTADEGFTTGAACNAGTPACVRPGARACTADGLAVECVPFGPPSPEKCNGVDDDCDFLVDEEFDEGDPCSVGIGACHADGKRVCDAAGTSTVCDAVEAPAVGEFCNDLDDDCDGETDEGCDDDHDGYCETALGGPSAACPSGDHDCDDAAELVHPGAGERCDTPIDDDCTGSTNDDGAAGCIYLYADGDGDGAGAGPSACLCVPDATFTVTVSGDCDDADGSRSSIANERCSTPFDDDCSGLANEPGSDGCIVYYRDQDADGAGAEADSRCLCGPEFPYTASKAGDCDDGSALFGPEVADVCDGLDNNCDGTTDGQVRPCATGCGSGEETCTAGVWAGCTATASPCSGGACCDSCGFLVAGTSCGGAPLEERTICVGGCGGTIRRERRYGVCSGDSPTCGAGGSVWVDAGLMMNCAGTAACLTSGNTASCTPCANGCSNGACVVEPAHTVCIDAGYGGTVLGPVSGALVGKDVTLSIALHLRDRLVADSAAIGAGGRWNVVMTRTTDVGLTADERAAACGAGAEVVLSVMTNAFTSDAANGAETYFDDAAGETFATEVQAEVVAAGGVTDRGVKSATFALLQAFSAPAASTFVGFVSGAVDAPKLGNDAWRKAVATGLLHALQGHFGYGVYTPP